MPELGCHLCLGTLWERDAAHSGPGPDDPGLWEHLRRAGITGVQGGDPGLARAAGMAWTSLACVARPEEVRAVLAREADRGARIVTLHAGTGLEDDDAALRLLTAVVDAADRLRITAAVETHRATITQDMARTVGFVRRLPELRFTADLSHWYCGQEMVYGDFAGKLAFIAPVLERVRLIHARIAEPGCIQSPEVADPALPHVAHFLEMWRRIFTAFRRSAGSAEVLPFAPELLPARISYARTVTVDGRRIEAHDRWADALVLIDHARRLWRETHPETA
ncbi:MAG: hypothetical protein RLZZ127_937 [Planctomycetota bacterium]